MTVAAQGILSAQDAVRGVDAGVDGIVVSNHGGRQLDTALASLDALPAVAAAVGKRVPVLMDGGIRRGTDVIKVGRLRQSLCSFLAWTRLSSTDCCCGRLNRMKALAGRMQYCTTFRLHAFGWQSCV